jgi:peptide/nickel transport system ATP-binding protein
MGNVLLVRNLNVDFMAPEGRIEAVRGVSFRVPQGKTVALVGESGSGKSVVSQSIMGILPKAGRITDGEIVFFDCAAGAFRSSSRSR